MASKTLPNISVVWPNPAEARATLVRETTSGRKLARPLGPRALLTLDEAAVVLGRSRAGVDRAISVGFLRTVRRNGRRYVTMRACRDYVREQQADVALIEAHAHETVTPAEEVYRQLGL